MRNNAKGVSLFQLIPQREFQQLCNRFKINKGVRKLTAKKQVWTLVMAFVLKLESLREIESILGIPRSTLSDAAANRNAKFFEELCKLVLWRIYGQLKSRKVKQAIRTLLALDSTECRVDGRLSKLKSWKVRNGKGTRGQKKAAVKLHVIWNVNGEWIEEFKITAARVHDSPAAMGMKIKAGCIYIFDRAYNNLKFWWSIVDQGSHIVSRLKKCSYSKSKHRRIVQENPQDGVIWDVPWKPSREVLRIATHVPKDFTLRHIIYRDPETKKIFDFITSDIEAPAQQIADTYRKRWAVELLFKWMKGHLKVRALEPRNTNAVQIQLAIAVLVQLLVQLQRMLTNFEGSLWECLRNLRCQWAKVGLNFMSLKSGVPEPFSPTMTPAAQLRPGY